MNRLQHHKNINNYYSIFKDKGKLLQTKVRIWNYKGAHYKNEKYKLIENLCKNIMIKSVKYINNE